MKTPKNTNQSNTKKPFKYRHAPKKLPKGWHKETPHERHHPEDSFFQKTESEHTINNVKSRLYGIQSRALLPQENYKNHDHKVRHISQILHDTTGIAPCLAYNAFCGKKWREESVMKIQHGLLNQLESGRSLEILLTEAMIRLGKGYHFIPPKELDRDHKIDMISRMPIRTESKMRSIAFGIQLTLTSINDMSLIYREIAQERRKEHTIKSKYPKHSIRRTATKPLPPPPSESTSSCNRYKEKYQKVEHSAHNMQSEAVRAKIAQECGRIFVPDIIAYTAINGKIRDTLLNSCNPTTTYFRKWRKNNFAQDGLLDFFHWDFREMMMTIAQILLETEESIIRELHAEKNYKRLQQEGTFGTEHLYTKTLRFNAQNGHLTLTLRYNGEIIMRTLFFLAPHMTSASPAQREVAHINTLDKSSPDI